MMQVSDSENIRLTGSYEKKNNEPYNHLHIELV